jgi:hypothetical protein
LNQHDSHGHRPSNRVCLHEFLRFLHPAKKVSPREEVSNV